METGAIKVPHSGRSGMEVLNNVVQYILGFGAAIFVPLIMLIMGLCIHMKFGDAFVAALTLGVAFTGMNLVINYMTGAVSPAAQAMAQNTGVALTTTDIGWPACSAVAWSWPLGVLCFPLHIVINIIMLAINKTDTLNVDLWNCWNKLFTAIIVYYICKTVAGYAEGTAVACAFIAAGIECVIELKMGDMWQPTIQKITGIPGVTVPHAMAATAVFLFPFELLLEKIPAIQNNSIDAKWLRGKIGIFAENSVMGFILGFVLGLLAGPTYFAGLASPTDLLRGSLTLAIQAATCMQLFPMVSKLFMQALSPISDHMGEVMKKRFAGRELHIGLDWPIVAGSNELWVTTIILIPVELLFAVLLVPVGNTVLPFAGIVNLCLAVPALFLAEGNLAKMIIMGIIGTPIYLLVGSAVAPYVTDLAKTYSPASLEGIASGNLITWSTMECPDFRWCIANAFAGNIIWIALFAVWIVVFVFLYKYMMQRNVRIKKELAGE